MLGFWGLISVVSVKADMMLASKVNDRILTLVPMLGYCMYQEPIASSNPQTEQL